VGEEGVGAALRAGDGEIIELETVGLGVITGVGDCDTDDVGRVRVQAVNAIEPIPISNLKYLTLDLN
jgi:hypothetical protein